LTNDNNENRVKIERRHRASSIEDFVDRLTYKVSPYAKERMKTSFKRIENKDKD